MKTDEHPSRGAGGRAMFTLSGSTWQEGSGQQKCPREKNSLICTELAAVSPLPTPWTVSFSSLFLSVR